MRPATSEREKEDSLLTLCEFCGEVFTPQARKRGSLQRFCRPSHKVAAWQRANRPSTLTLVRIWAQDRTGALGVITEPARRRRTRRARFPNGCWSEDWECLSRHPDCSCDRCRFNECACWSGLKVSPLVSAGYRTLNTFRQSNEGVWHGSNLLY